MDNNKKENPSGIELKSFYSDSDIKDNAELGNPGSFPFTRGVYSTMYSGRPWTMRQYAGFGTAEETNERFKYLLKNGQTGLSVAFDLPTQLGLDSDDKLAEGEVGKVGVAICSVKDMMRLFDGIPLDKVSTSMTINASSMIILAMYIVTAKKQGVSMDKLSGTIQNDILKEYTARGNYIFPPEPSMRLTADIFEFCSKNLPKWNTISISGYHIREAGSTAVQELAFTFADAIAYVEYALKKGLDIDAFAPRLSFFFNAHNNFFEEIAKFRAARKIWSDIMKNRFHAKDEKSMMLRFHTQTAGSMLTAQQPQNNIVRVALQALSAVLGGTQSLHTNSYDEALALPTEESVRIALRTQQIIAFETGICDVADPVGGSYYLESLTNEIEQRVQEYLMKIDKMGGAVKCVESGYFKNEIHNAAYQYQKDVESGKNIVVGLNKFTIDEKVKPNLMKIDSAVEAKRREKLSSIRKSRDNKKVDDILAKIKNACSTSENLFPLVLDAVENDVTMGEIINVMKSKWGLFDND
ncbi:TPA: methylmalonyl-CoA mutase [candidate division WOR-3 bacterium]|jgi:methylmalonyl-CoA mutase N-terminal domain/subunit|uniref:Methylmalonyl-CoA mutase n=1 Tax=candidate division WOR-3 bacterium TaxID=2052148 RepID=A0A350H7V9_UNCW3|nr:methylmalonyl-CoA mutase [candidate division WOR-3 bacterium]